MRKSSSQSPQYITHELRSLLKERLEGRRNLVYYASGSKIRDGYSELPYDNVVLVDSCFREAVSVKGKVICVGLWSTFATALFKDLGVKFDAFITGNDGLSEGGGAFPINGNFCLSNVLPVLNDSWIHLAFPKQYRRAWKKLFLDMPFTSTLLTPTDSGYLDPSIFSSMNKEGKVWRVIKKSEAPVSFKHGRRHISIIRGNIWDDYDALDALFVRVPPVEARNLKNVYQKVECVKDFTYEQILEYCNTNKITKIGLCPFNGNYSAFLQFIKDRESAYPLPSSIHFYHLHKNDYPDLYKRAVENTDCVVSVGKVFSSIG